MRDSCPICASDNVKYDTKVKESIWDRDKIYFRDMCLDCNAVWDRPFNLKLNEKELSSFKSLR